MLAKLCDLDCLGLLGGVRVIRAGVDLELAVHRVAHLRLREHAAHGLLHDPGGPGLAPRALPTLTEMAVMVNDQGRLARNQLR